MYIDVYNTYITEKQNTEVALVVYFDSFHWLGRVCRHSTTMAIAKNLSWCHRLESRKRRSKSCLHLRLSSFLNPTKRRLQTSYPDLYEKEMKEKLLTNAITLQKSRRLSNKGGTDDLSGRASGSKWDHRHGILIFRPRGLGCIPHMLQGSQLLVVNVSLTPNQLLLWSSESF